MAAVVIRAEVRRAVRSRPVGLALVLSLTATVVVGYLAVRALLGLVDGSDGPGPAEISSRIGELKPARLREGMATVTSQTLPVVALICGGLLVRGDHRDHVLRLLVGRGPSRRAVAVGKIAALAVLSVVASTLTTAAALVCAVVLSQGTPRWVLTSPGDLTVLVSVGAASWLVWSLIGLCASVLLRSGHAAPVAAVVWLLTSGPVLALAAQGGPAGPLHRLSPATAVHELLLGTAGTVGHAAAVLGAATTLLVAATVTTMCRTRVD